MITKKDAIAIAEAIAYGGLREIGMAKNDVNKIEAIRGAVFAAADNVYYEILPTKISRQFVGVKSHNENYLDVVRNILNK